MMEWMYLRRGMVDIRDNLTLRIPRFTVTKPTAAVENRGSMIREEGGAGVADTLLLSMKTEADTYTWTDLTQLLPAGGVIAWMTNTAPTGWLLCDGSLVSRTTYAALYSVIGTTYGAGDGSTTFALPNLKGRIPVGRDSGVAAFDTLAETGGAVDVTLTSAQSGLPAHNHAVNITSGTNSVGHTHTQQTFVTATDTTTANAGTRLRQINAATGGLATSTQSANHTHAVVGNTDNITSAGAAAAHSNLQPYLVVNYVIKV